MASKPKLTPTFADQVANGGGVQTATPVTWPQAMIPAPRIEGPHEPIQGDIESQRAVGFDPLSIRIPITDHQNPAAVARPPLKVALVGTAPSSRMLAPFNDPSWEIWACSPGNMNTLPRVTVWFELHGNLLWPEHASYGPAYIEWLKQQTFPIFMQNQELVPNATVFPKDDLVQKFGKDFFTSSFAWMMAKAIDSGATEIALYGIDMASRDEYVRQRPGFFYFKDQAEKRGIKVSAPNESDIMMHPGLYGYSEVTPFGRKILARRQELRQRADAMRAEKSRLEVNIAYLDGALEDVDYFEMIWIGVGDRS